MVIVGVILAEASFLPCTGSQAPVIAPQSWVLALFTGQMEGRFGGAVCPGPPPLAMQLARVVCLGATFTGVAAAAAVLWRAEIDRLKTRFVGELTVMTGLDEMTVALLGRLVTEPGRGQVVLVEADPNHPLLEEARATGARVIIADPGQAGALRPVLIHLGLARGAAGLRAPPGRARQRDDPRRGEAGTGAGAATGCGGRFPPGAPGNHRGAPGTTSMSSSARTTSARCGRCCRRPSTWDGCGARCGPSHPGPSSSSPMDKIKKRGRQLFYDRDGSEVRIERIYNRVIFDELIRRPDLNLPFQFQDELDVTWVGHPNWYFRISKHSLPFLKTEYTSPTFFADDFPANENIGDYVLKPLYSFAGHGVDMEPTGQKIAALENPCEWILQKKVDYAPFVVTVDGKKSKAEIRMMFVWPDNDRNPTLVNNLVRMSQGKMMGVDFNVDKTWVGASIALHEA